MKPGKTHKIRYSFVKILTGSDLSNRRLPLMEVKIVVISLSDVSNCSTSVFLVWSETVTIWFTFAIKLI